MAKMIELALLTAPSNPDTLESKLTSTGGLLAYSGKISKNYNTNTFSLKKKI